MVSGLPVTAVLCQLIHLEDIILLLVGKAQPSAVQITGNLFGALELLRDFTLHVLGWLLQYRESRLYLSKSLVRNFVRLGNVWRSIFVDFDEVWGEWPDELVVSSTGDRDGSLAERMLLHGRERVGDDREGLEVVYHLGEWELGARLSVLLVLLFF